MLKKITLLTTLVVLAVIAMDAKLNFIMSNGTGAPADHTGGPASSGTTCRTSGCHDSYATTFPAPAGSLVVAAAGTLTPVTSYTPGAAYDVYVTSVNSTNAKSGFEVSFENASGHQGVLTAGTNNALTGSGHYVTHTANSTAGPVLNWKFSWTAPSAGAGTITAYAAINKANNDFTRVGDSIKVITVALSQTAGIGIDAVAANALQVSAYPNPVMSEAIINYNTSTAAANSIAIYNLAGALVNQVDLGTEAAGAHHTTINMANLSNGTYVMVLSNGTSTVAKKIVKN